MKSKRGKTKGKEISDRRDLIVSWAARKMEQSLLKGNKEIHKIYSWALGRLKNCPTESDKLTEIYLVLCEQSN